MKKEIYEQIKEEWEKGNIRVVLKLYSDACYNDKLITFKEYNSNKRIWEDIEISEKDLYMFYRFLSSRVMKRIDMMKNPMTRDYMLKSWDEEEQNEKN